MTDSLAATVATALVSGAAAALSDGVRALLHRVSSLVRERFRRDSSDQDALAAALRQPHDHPSVARLAKVLARHMAEDPAFADELRGLWSEVAEATRQAQVTNLVTGEVHGSVVQARDVQGGITFHAPPR